MRLIRQNNRAIFSHVQYRPLNIMAPMISQQITTDTTGGMWKMLSAAVMPMNSVIIVSQSVMTRSSNENQPQKVCPEGRENRFGVVTTLW